MGVTIYKNEGTYSQAKEEWLTPGSMTRDEIKAALPDPERLLPPRSLPPINPKSCEEWIYLQRDEILQELINHVVYQGRWPIREYAEKGIDAMVDDVIYRGCTVSESWKDRRISERIKQYAESANRMDRLKKLAQQREIKLWNVSRSYVDGSLPIATKEAYIDGRITLKEMRDRELNRRAERQDDKDF